MKTSQQKNISQVENKPAWDERKIFIDWLTIREENTGQWPELNDGHVISCDRNGVEEYTVQKRLAVKGSHDSSAQVRVTKRELEISFNPSRFNRNDNLFGCTYEQAIRKVNNLLYSLGLKPIEKYLLTRVDVTLNVSCGNKAKLDTYIRHLKKSTLPRKKTYTSYDAAIFQNKRVKITVYKKHQEIIDNNKIKHDMEDKQARNIEQRLRIARYCEKQGVARVEVRLGRKALIDKGLRNGESNNQNSFVKAFNQEIEKMPKNSAEAITEELTDQELGSLLMWKAGYNPREKITRQTFYKRRKAILEKTGFDIGGEMPSKLEQKNETVKTETTEIPEWYEMPEDEKDPRQKNLELVK